MSGLDRNRLGPPDSNDGDSQNGKKSSSPQPLSASSQSPLSGSQHEFHMASTSGTRLAQEIHDEFLCCKICLEAYKNPKSLNCLHTFCEQCIENHVMSESTYKKYSDYRDFTCPLCRKRTQLPIGGVKKLPDNFLVSSLTEMVGRQKPSKYPFCDICKMVNRKHREATSKCLDCNKLLCSTCLELHKETKVTAGHSIFDVEIEKDIECKEHQDEVVRFYCEPCEACICVLCTFNEHRDHEITQFGEAVVKYKENIQKLLGTCTAKLDKYDSQLDALNECEETIKTAEQRIHDVAIEFIQEIRTREKQLVEELRNIYGRETMEYIDHKKDVAAQVESLRSTCSLTDVILKGKDIELLLLKKDVQEKLTTLNEIEVKNLPRTISKVVKFLPGNTDLGVLQDLDRPGLSTMRAKRPCEDDGRADGRGCPVNLVEKQTQTDESALRKKTASECTEETEDSEDESSEEDSSDEDDEGPNVEEKAVQTERVNRAVSETKDESTLTDEVETEDKGVNTRSRSLQALSSVHGATIADDGSLAARRRRRRERAQTSYIGPGSQYNDSGRSYEAGDEPSKYRRSRFLSNNSLDSDDSYYDTAPHSATNHL